jgi:hypothetical protein
MNKYRVYCETHGWVEVISSSEPTVCPVSAGDTLRAGSTVITDSNVIENPDGIATELSLDDYKLLKHNAIDRRTGELISVGYTYATKQFSFSPNAQINILALDNTKDDPALTYPIVYNTIDDIDTYSIVDSADLHAMYLTALATKKAHLDSGTVLKDQVRSAIDKAGVDAVIDNR